MEAKPPRTAWSSAGMGVGGVSPLVVEVRGSIHGKKFASFTAKSCTVVNIRSENALHLSIENLEIDVLSLGFITSFLGLGVVLAHCMLGCRIKFNDPSLSISSPLYCRYTLTEHLSFLPLKPHPLPFPAAFRLASGAREPANDCIFHCQTKSVCKFGLNLTL